MTYQGTLYAVPETIDMQLLVYRKSLLSHAGVRPPQTIDELIDAAKALTTKNVKGLFVGNDGGVGVLGGPALWSAGLDYLTDDDKVGFDDPAAATSLGKLHKLFTSGSLLLGAPTDWSDPSAINQGLAAMQWTGLWNVPAMTKALGDDFGVVAWPKLSDSVGAPSVPVGAYGEAVSAKSHDVAAAKAFVKWLWVEQHRLPARLRAELRLPHPGADQPGGQGRQAEVRPGGRRREAGPRERPGPDPAAVDAGLRHRLLRRREPHRQGRRQPGRPAQGRHHQGAGRAEAGHELALARRSR